MPASQRSCVAETVLPVARGPDNGVEGGKQGATGKLLFRNLNFTATVVSEGVRQQGRDHRTSGSAPHPTWHRGNSGDEPEENEKESPSCL